MYPLLLELGPLTIYSIWLFVAIGFFVALLIMNKLIQKNRLDLKLIADHSLSIFLAGLILGRIVFVARNFDYFFPNFEFQNIVHIFYIWDKGLSPWGGILGILLMVSLFAWQNKQDIGKWLDVFSVGILGAITFANIGAFFDGRNYGHETILPWGILMENSKYAVPIHPTQIYATIYSGILTSIFFKYMSKRKSKYSGQATLLIVLSYSVLRFIEEFFRGDESEFFLGLREAQIYALIAIVVTATTLIIFKKYNKSEHGNI